MTIPSWCRVGVKVVFVGGGTEFPDSPDALTADLEEGSIYVIESITDERRACRNRRAVYLAVAGWPDEYLIECFRPLVSQEDDIATHFQHHLDHSTPADLVRA